LSREGKLEIKEDVMGCIYACTCGGNCLSCNSYRKESYFGEAEDLADQQQGYETYDEMLSRNAQR
jgi:hypothetical protein